MPLSTVTKSSFTDSRNKDSVVAGEQRSLGSVLHLTWMKSNRKLSILMWFMGRKMSQGRRQNVQHHPSKSSSLNSQEILDVMHPDDGTLDTILGVPPRPPCYLPPEGMCRGEPLSNRGKRLKIVKILSVTLLPFLSLWFFTLYSLSDRIQGKSDIEQTQYAVKFSVEIGMFLDRIQRERDMSVLYLSILGPETKTFLMNEYLLTNQALEQLSDWPVRTDISTVFHSKQKFQQFLEEHRENLDPTNYDIYVEMDFYNFLIERFIEWMYGAIRESNMASIWKILVAYQKIVTVMEHTGIERALGTVFYVEGGFPVQAVFERYNNRVNIFKANYRSAVLYSKAVEPIFQDRVTATGTNLTAVIESFRYQIQHIMHTNASITNGQWLFDNMTLYLDTLLIIQQELANLINGQLEEIIQIEEQNLAISACFQIIVFLMFPLVIYSVETLTSDIQRYAVALVHKIKELSKEKKKKYDVHFRMVPRSIVKDLERGVDVNPEYFKEVTIMFSDIVGIKKMPQNYSILELIDLLNSLFSDIDDILAKYDVYKVESINDSSMIVSGAPNRMGNRHSAEIANLALELLAMMEQRFSDSSNKLQMRIGINNGPCVAGIVGTVMPRYRLFGDAIKMAAQMKNYGLPNKIQLSGSSYKSLRKHKTFVTAYRGAITIKDKWVVKTYWLQGKTDPENTDGPDKPTVSVRVYEEVRDMTEAEGESTDAHLHDLGKFGTFDIIPHGSETTAASSNLFLLDDTAEGEKKEESKEEEGRKDCLGRREAGTSGKDNWCNLSAIPEASSSKQGVGGTGSLPTSDDVNSQPKNAENRNRATEEEPGSSGTTQSSAGRKDPQVQKDSVITYDSLGMLTQCVEQEGKANLLRDCMSQGHYENEAG